ncbi:MAG: TRAP transporter large permease subunit [Betaproteobacteria bacterium]|nr:TRAP transporter large permease subunit [Betaproteobacteria bacterium]
MTRAFSALTAALSALGSLWIFAIMLLICGDIAGRALFNTPIQRTPELVALSVPCLVFLQLPQVIRAGRMIHADLILRVIEQRAAFAGHLYGLLFALAGITVFGVVLLWTVPDLLGAIRTAEFAGVEGAYAVIVWPFKLAVVIGAAFAALSFVAMAAAHVKGIAARRAADRRPESSNRLGWIALAALAILILAYIGVNFLGHLRPTEIGAISVLGMLVLLLAGMPIGTALFVLSFIGIWLVRGSETIAVNAVGLAASNAISSYDFAVIPLYVLMGLLVEKAEVGRDAFAVAASLLRRVRGGLGMATVLANALFASITGSSIASATVFARVAVPEMVDHGYSRRFSVGTVAGSSVLGMLIPPSLLLIIYGLVSEVSIGKLFIAAIIPGLLLAAAFMGMISFVAKTWPRFVGNPKAIAEIPNMPVRASLIALLPMLVLIVVVIGGIYGGVMTPTESGAVGAAGALVIAIARRKLPRSEFTKVLVEAGLVTGAILFLIIAAALYSRMLALSGIPTYAANLVSQAGLGLPAFLAIYLLIVVLLGTILDSVSIMLMVLPVMLPIVTALGGNLVWFGILTTISVEIGLLTPPFGISVYVVNSTLPKNFTNLREIFEGTIPFVLTMMAVTILVAALPILSTVLVR